MIILNKGEVNDIYVTVADIVDDSNGEYILSLENTVSKQVTDISMSRVNTDTIRYDKFQINEASHSLEEGKYDYTIKTVSGSIAEYGKLEVIGSESSSSVYNKADNTTKVYNRS